MRCWLSVTSPRTGQRSTAPTRRNVELTYLSTLTVEPAGGYVFSWDKSAGKIKAFQSAAAGDFDRRFGKALDALSRYEALTAES